VPTETNENKKENKNLFEFPFGAEVKRDSLLFDNVIFSCMCQLCAYPRVAT
jgi:hypothetical protein